MSDDEAAKAEQPAEGERPVETRPTVSATPDGDTQVFDDLPEWARRLSKKRKKLLAGLAHVLPQAYNGVGLAPYDQGGKMINSNSWWGGAKETGTSCTSFQPKVIAKFFEGGKDPNPEKWGYNAGGTPKDAPHPQWRGAEKPENAPPAMPQPGDAYILWVDYKLGTYEPGIRHVGHIAYAPEEPDTKDDCWVTADGGQGQRDGVHCNLVPKVGTFGPAYLYLGPRTRPPIEKALHFHGGAETGRGVPPFSPQEQRAWDEYQTRREAAIAAGEEPPAPGPNPKAPWNPAPKDPATNKQPHLVGWVSIDELTGATEDFDADDFRDVVGRIERVRQWYLKNK